MRSSLLSEHGGTRWPARQQVGDDLRIFACSDELLGSAMGMGTVGRRAHRIRTTPAGGPGARSPAAEAGAEAAPGARAVA